MGMRKQNNGDVWLVGFLLASAILGAGAPDVWLRLGILLMLGAQLYQLQYMSRHFAWPLNQMSVLICSLPAVPGAYLGSRIARACAAIPAGKPGPGDEAGRKRK